MKLNKDELRWPNKRQKDLQKGPHFRWDNHYFFLLEFFNREDTKKDHEENTEKSIQENVDWSCNHYDPKLIPTENNINSFVEFDV